MSSPRIRQLKRISLAREYFRSVGVTEDEIDARVSEAIFASRPAIDDRSDSLRAFARALFVTCRGRTAQVLSTAPASLESSSSGAPQPARFSVISLTEQPIEALAMPAEESSSNRQSPRAVKPDASSDFAPITSKKDPRLADDGQHSDDGDGEDSGSVSASGGAVLRVPSGISQSALPLRDDGIAAAGNRRSRTAPIVTVEGASPPRAAPGKRGGMRSNRVSWSEFDGHTPPGTADATPRDGDDGDDGDDDAQAFNMHDSVQSVRVKRAAPNHPVQFDDDDGVGCRVVNEYVITQEIGRGAYGKVYQAGRTTDNKQFAIKIVSSRPTISSAAHSAAVSTCATPQPAAAALAPPQPEELRGIPRTVLREITIMRRFQNDYLLPLEEVLHDSSRHLLFLVLPLMKGPLLTCSTNRCNVTSSLYSEATAKRLIFQISTGLRYLHKKGVVHLDIKPANILLTPEDNAVISDFGTTQICNPGEHSPAAAGSPAYLPPEALGDAVETIADGAAADMWALGITWYMMIVGDHPFSKGVTRTPAAMQEKILTEPLVFPADSLNYMSNDCQTLIASMLDRNVAARLTAKQLRDSPYMAEERKSEAERLSLHPPLPGPMIAESNQGDEAVGIITPRNAASTPFLGPRAIGQGLDASLLLSPAPASLLTDDPSPLLKSPTNQQMERAVTEVRRVEYKSDSTLASPSPGLVAE